MGESEEELATALVLRARHSVTYLRHDIIGEGLPFPSLLGHTWECVWYTRLPGYMEAAGVWWVGLVHGHGCKVLTSTILSSGPLAPHL